MKHTLAWVFTIGLGALALSGCGSSDAPATGAPISDAAPVSDAAPTADARDPNLNCVKPGTPNNEKGVAGYCEAPTDCATGAMCTAVSPLSGQYEWFCTILCNVDSDCGLGAHCNKSTGVGACVPLACEPGDAGAGD